MRMREFEFELELEQAAEQAAELMNPLQLLWDLYDTYDQLPDDVKDAIKTHAQSTWQIRSGLWRRFLVTVFGVMRTSPAMTVPQAVLAAGRQMKLQPRVQARGRSGMSDVQVRQYQRRQLQRGRIPGTTVRLRVGRQREFEHELEQASHMLRETAVGQMEAKPMNRAQYWTCSAAEQTKIENVLNMSVAPATLRSAVADAALRGAQLAWTAAAALQTSSPSQRTLDAFQNAFGIGVAPSAVPAWRPAKSSWANLGDLVAVRLNSAARILNGGWIRYFCWGSAAHCPECTGSPVTDYRACSSYKNLYRICLGAEFWQWWRDRKFDLMATTLLHEALHIYYGRKGVAHDKRVNNAHCYQVYVSQINGAPMSPCRREQCLGVPC